MPEIYQAMQAYEVNYRCDFCRKGCMRSTGIMLTSNPPQFPHRCDNKACDMQAVFEKTYPAIEHHLPPAGLEP